VKGLDDMLIADRILAQHAQMVRDAVFCLEGKEMDSFRLYYGRAQGLELAMGVLGIDYTPVHITSQSST
jgi:hypothetical protein